MKAKLASAFSSGENKSRRDFRIFLMSVPLGSMKLIPQAPRLFILNPCSSEAYEGFLFSTDVFTDVFQEYTKEGEGMDAALHGETADEFNN